MGLKVKALHVGDILMDWSFLLFGYNAGRKTCIPINSFLILGAEVPILVDTGIRDVNLIPPGMKGWETPEQSILKLLGEKKDLSPVTLDTLSRPTSISTTRGKLPYSRMLK